tara:strand:+ start:249 stop:1595 length:1347 start_codon:yes stop_codon:yes gene_type:complete
MMTTTSKAALFLDRTNIMMREICEDLAKNAEHCLKAAKAIGETRADLMKYGHYEMAADSDASIERNIATSKRYIGHLIRVISKDVPIADKPLYDSAAEAYEDIQEAFEVDLSMLLEPREKTVRYSSDGFTEMLAEAASYLSSPLRFPNAHPNDLRRDVKRGMEFFDACGLMRRDDAVAPDTLQFVMDMPVEATPDFNDLLKVGLQRLKRNSKAINLASFDHPWVVAHAIVDIERVVRDSAMRMIPVIFEGDRFPTAVFAAKPFLDPTINNVDVWSREFGDNAVSVVVDYVEGTQAFKPWGLNLDLYGDEDVEARLCETELEYRELAGQLADDLGVDIIDEGAISLAYEDMTCEGNDQDWDEALDSARDVLPFMTEDSLFAVVQPKSYVEAEILGSRLAELMMAFVMNDESMREHIPMLVMREMISNPEIDSRSPVVKGFLDGLEIRSA